MGKKAGDRLGPYEILQPIGAGGMGEVYKARDTRLDRLVAIKVSKEQFSERFEREARAISALNHRNICTLYDVGPDYLVMEYIEGKQLIGPLPLEKALNYANQILEALHAAHSKGIVHRDLKPANILATDTGIKLLDFGLARTRRSGEEETENTLTLALTQDHIVVGTPQYMAPEQIEAKEVDARADIFAFGCVFYEILTGEKAFDGTTPQSVMAKILAAEPPPFNKTRLTVPSGIQLVLDACLKKNPADRWQTARDVQIGLAAVRSSGAEVIRPKQPMFLIAILAAAALIALAALVYSVARRQRSLSGAQRVFTLTPPPGTNEVLMAAVSPDGASVAFIAGNRLWIRRLDSLNSIAVPGTEEARQPFWSPDSRQIGFFAEGKIKKVSLSGGGSQVLASAINTNQVGAAWWQGREKAFIVFSERSVLARVDASGGPVSRATSLREGERIHRFPSFLPDGRLLYTVEGIPTVSGVVTSSFNEKGEATERHKLLPNAIGYGYLNLAGTGDTILFARREALFGQRVDLASNRMIGEPFPIGAEIQSAAPGIRTVSATADGSVIAFAARFSETGEVVLIDRHGRHESVLSPTGIYVNLRLSPDGTKVAFARTGVSLDLWVVDLARRTESRITSHPDADGVPAWSLDGRNIAFATWRDAKSSIYVTSATGETQEHALIQSTSIGDKYPSDWSPDRNHLLYIVPGEGGWDIWVARLSLDQTAQEQRPFLATEFNETDARFSPDGRWVAYSSNETGRTEIYIRSFPNATGKYLVSTAGGAKPEWRGDGRELFYLSPDRQLMAAPVTLGATVTVDTPVKLFAISANPSGFGPQYGVLPTGNKFVVLARPQDLSATSVVVGLNWRLAPD